MTDHIEKKVDFEVDLERVWRAITNGAELAKWFPDGAAFDLGPGAEGQFVWRNHGSYAVRVEAFEPPHRLAWRWAKNPDTSLEEGPSTLVEFFLSERVGGGTVLTVKESGFLSEEHRRSNLDGWAHELGQLEEFVTGVADQE